MLESTTTEIDGVEYTFRPLMANAARQFLLKLTGILGPVFGDGIKKLDTSKIGELKDSLDEAALVTMIPVLGNSLGSMLSDLFGNLSPKVYEEFVDNFLKQVTARLEEEDENGNARIVTLKRDTRNTMFATKLLTEARILVWCLGEQYSDFFVFWKKASASALTEMLKVASLSSFQKTMIGESTESQPASGTPAL